MFTRTARARGRAPWVTARNTAWKTFSSVKLPLILILALIGLTLIGTLVSQVPSRIEVGSADYVSWLAQAKERFGPLTPVMDGLQLFYVFNSSLFKVAGVLLLLNIVVCAPHRTGGFL